MTYLHAVVETALESEGLSLLIYMGTIRIESLKYVKDLLVRIMKQ
jgi:hypothetical protein